MNGVVVRSKRYGITLLFNANKVYDRQVIEGIGEYLQASQCDWDIFFEDDFRCQIDSILSWMGDGIIADFDDPEIVAAIIANPNAKKGLKFSLGWQEPGPEPAAGSAEDRAVQDDAAESGDEDGDNEGRNQVELEALMEEADREGMSKYQIALELKVAEKIKMGLTGDKEWRSLMIKQSNKLIQAAVLKNPRITDGEVLMIAKNKTSSEDLIRMILLNKDWMKLYDIKKALITHPKTPPPKSMRLVPLLTMKDLKDLAKSRQVSTLVSTAARKELEMRLKKTGG